MAALRAEDLPLSPPPPATDAIRWARQALPGTVLHALWEAVQRNDPELNQILDEGISVLPQLDEAEKRRFGEAIMEALSQPGEDWGAFRRIVRAWYLSVLARQGRIKVDPGQAWFWTPEWLLGELEAEEEIAAGKGARYASDEEFERSLRERMNRQ